MINKDAVVKAQVLYDFVVLKKDVLTDSLSDVTDSLFKRIKLDGIGNTTICFTDENGHEISLTGYDIPIEMRAMSLFINRLIHRWDDSHSGRLEEHYGLPISANAILADTGILQINALSLPCICVNDVIQAYIAN